MTGSLFQVQQSFSTLPSRVSLGLLIFRQRLQRVSQIRRRLVTLPRVAFDGLDEDASRFLIEVRRVIARVAARVVHPVAVRLVRPRAIPRQKAASQHLIRRYAESEDVHAVVGLQPLEQLWREVIRGARAVAGAAKLGLVRYR